MTGLSRCGNDGDVSRACRRDGGHRYCPGGCECSCHDGPGVTADIGRDAVTEWREELGYDPITGEVP